MTILKSFPGHLTPRPIQVQALEAIEAKWASADVFVVNLPVASGKSAIAMTLARWVSSLSKRSQKSVLLAPNNLLVNQYRAEYPKLHVLKGQDGYFCSTWRITIKELKRRISVKRTKNKLKYCGPESFPDCQGCAEYLSDIKKTWAMPYMLSNYHIYLAHRLFKRYGVVIVDEAHNLISVLQDMAASKIWHHTLPPAFQYPLNIRSTDELRAWLSSLPSGYVEDHQNLRHFRDCLDSNKYIFRAATEDYNGEEQHCIKLIPLDLRDEPARFFPDGAIQKIVLLSATLSKKDIEQLGLYTRRITYIEAASPIPASQRPVIVARDAKNMGYRNQDENMEHLVELIRTLLDEHQDVKGLLHAPYSLALKIKTALARVGDPALSARLLFHNKENKQRVYQEFRARTDNAVLIGSGLYEGVDLPYDAGRFQMIAKIPFPSLAEPAVAYKAQEDSDWYAWETCKIVQQAIGRICRGPDDFGSTYILDSTFNKLYFDNKKMWPAWLQESVTWRNIL